MKKTFPINRLKSIQLGLLILCSSISICSFAQNPTDSFPKDPGHISVYAVQNLSFGAIYQGNAGGTVAITPGGSRSVTGDVVAINQSVMANAAVFEVEAAVGTLVTFQNGPDATLTGSNGGTMTLHLGASSPTSPFSSVITPPGRTQVSIGGTLTVGSVQSSKPGTYSGTFSITFFQQ